MSYVNRQCTWRIRARLANESIKVIKYVGAHTCGLLKTGKDHILATSEWIAYKCKGLYYDGHDVAQKVIAMKKYYFVLPSYRSVMLLKKFWLNE